MTKTIAIIPARGNSKRLPGKNIKLLGGLPLIAHSILYAKNNIQIIDEIYSVQDEIQRQINQVLDACKDNENSKN